MRTDAYMWGWINSASLAFGANWRTRKTGEVYNPLHLLGRVSLYWRRVFDFHVTLPFHLLDVTLSSRDYECNATGLFVHIGLLPNVHRAEGQRSCRHYWTLRPALEAHA